ncbi:MAG TPA: acyl-CoA dehydrogenase family protein [Caulobacteraceae bacterium]|jgi:alkylation response protein AidB-like acyl-CoA dehydrogenase|nr:acyl-CoA dehydrogenase family protein [Caulobacteraceae bacterium]
MDYFETAAETEFRLKVRDWLAGNAPKNWRAEAKTDAEMGPLLRRWQRTLYDGGFVGVTWPVEYGGRGLGPTYEAILNDELGKADTPRISFHNYLGRALFTYGTEAQKQRFLPPMLRGDIQWCQGFSEPNAGSDLASLRTFAELKGDRYVVNGQKLWTSGAQHADWCVLLVRTDREAAKHRGISCLLTPVTVPGVTIRPIRISDGQPETCEMFFDDVEVPADQRIGDEGAGWRIAMTVLAYERGPADIGLIATFQTALRRLEAMAVERGLARDAETRKAISRVYVLGEALRLNVVEQLSQRSAGRPPGPEGSVARLLLTQAEQALRTLELDIAGAAAFTDPEDGAFASYLRSRTISIFGGTSQIQKNILAQQVLGMPR